MGKGTQLKGFTIDMREYKVIDESKRCIMDCSRHGNASR